MADSRLVRLTLTFAVVLTSLLFVAPSWAKAADYFTEDDIVLGNKDAKHKVIVFISPD